MFIFLSFETPINITSRLRKTKKDQKYFKKATLWEILVYKCHFSTAEVNAKSAFRTGQPIEKVAWFKNFEKLREKQKLVKTQQSKNEKNNLTKYDVCSQSQVWNGKPSKFKPRWIMQAGGDFISLIFIIFL